MKTERIEFIREVRPNTVRIQLQKRIGQGLSSEVFEGVRIDSRGLTSQSVAVKITKSQEDVHVLRREFETLSKVQSTHLVKVYSWDNDGDECLLSMELIDGVSLADIFDANIMDPELVEEIVTQMQEGLKALAEKGLRHGDLSLNNALITLDGVVKLIDFANPELSRSYIHGTPPYVAPEVWNGDPCTIESDLFSLGLLREDLLSRVTNHFYEPPKSIEAARERCQRRASRRRGADWLSENSCERVFTNRESSPIAQARLARLVRKMKGMSLSTHRISHPPFSQNHLPSKPWYKKGLVVVSLPMVCLMLISGCWTDHPHNRVQVIQAEPNTRSMAETHVAPASTPAERAGSLSPPSEVFPKAVSNTNVALLRNRVRPSMRLATGSLQIRSHLWMNLSLEGKALGYAPVSASGLAPGQYRLKWQTHTKAGVKSIVIRSGQQTTLQDSDF